MRRVAEGLYQLEAGGFVNAYLISGSDLTLVDSGHSRSGKALLQEIQDNGFRLQDIARVVLTHAHADHVGGLKALFDHHRVRVYAHPRDIPVLMGNAPRVAYAGISNFFRSAIREYRYPWKTLDVVMPLEHGTPLRALPQWQVLHTPGHTAGSLCLFNPITQILLCGDALTHYGGRLRLSQDGGNRETAQHSLAVLAKLDCDILCCGHGPVLRGGAFRYIEALLT